MLFTSYIFLFVFLPVCVAGSALIGRVTQGAPRRGPVIGLIWLLGMSLVFYGWWNPPFVALLLLSITMNYGLGLAIAHRRDRAPRRSSWLLASGVAANLALIGYFKYFNFFVDTVNAMLATSEPTRDIFLPLGISFFTFQQIAYLADCRQGTSERGFVPYALFVSFFPQLIAGPIVHHREMMPQLSERLRTGRAPNTFALGLTVIAIGLAKKVCIADAIEPMASELFDVIAVDGTPRAADAWLGVTAYAMQIYFDFSGYSDMAIGLGLLFGVRLPLNFASPYKSTNIVVFWRSWHMTLSRFLRDYLYIPLGGSRQGVSRRYVNLMLTMLLGGLWHGAGWTFVIWGGLHGLYLCTFRLWQFLLPGAGGPPSRLGVLAGRSLTFLVVLVAWIPFRAADMDVASSVLRGLVSAGSGSTLLSGEPLTTATQGIALVLAVVIAFVCPNTQQLVGYTGSRLPTASPSDEPAPGWRPTMRWALATGFLLAIAFIALPQPRVFIYFQF